jgi:hypothetical protein
MPRTTNEDLRNAIQHAIDVLEEPGDAFKKTDILSAIFILRTALSGQEPD